MRWFLSFFFVALWSFVLGLSSSGNRLLVVIEDATEQDNYSKLWADLKDRGFSVSFESPKSEKLALVRYGVREYDHLILLPPKSKGLGPSLTPKIILDFIKLEGNVLLTLSAESPTPTSISSFLLELGIILPSDKKSVTVDHFSCDTLSAGEKHDVLLLSQPTSARPDIKNFFGGDGIVAFPRAVAQSLADESPLLSSILKAQSTSYCYDPKEDPETIEDPFATGEQISLVSAMQARNSARFTVFGSVEALQNKWFDAKVKTLKGDKTGTANRQFAQQVTEWTFKETGVLKVGTIQHYLSEVSAGSGNNSVQKVGNFNPPIYRVKNDVTFNIELSEYTLTHYSPPVLPAADALQLEFTMLSPFHRVPLVPISQTANSTIYSATFTCPDQHGIFSFRVNYKRPYLTNVEVKEEVTVRHFAHDEYPRSWTISGGWVWIAGIWVTIIGWLAFVALWLWSEPAKEQKDMKKKQ